MIVCPAVNVAGDPVLAAVSVQFHDWPTTADPLTLFALLSVRSEASAMAHSENGVIPAVNDAIPVCVTWLAAVSTVPPCATQLSLPFVSFHRTNLDSVIPPASSVGSMYRNLSVAEIPA